MDLIVNQIVQLQVVHVSDGNSAVKVLAGTSVSQADLTVTADGHTLPKLPVLQMGAQVVDNRRLQQVFVFSFKLIPGQVHIIVGHFQGIHNVVLVCAVENRGGYVEAQGLGCKA